MLFFFSAAVGVFLAYKVQSIDRTLNYESYIRRIFTSAGECGGRHSIILNARHNTSEMKVKCHVRRQPKKK